MSFRILRRLNHEGIYRRALDRILALDLRKDDRGRDDFYSGPDRFFRAWLIAHAAVQTVKKQP